MTNQEEIYILSQVKSILLNDNSWSKDSFIDMAISALESQEQKKLGQKWGFKNCPAHKKPTEVKLYD